MWHNGDSGQNREVQVCSLVVIHCFVKTNTLCFRSSDEFQSEVKPDKVVDNLAQAVDFILS